MQEHQVRPVGRSHGSIGFLGHDDVLAEAVRRTSSQAVGRSRGSIGIPWHFPSHDDVLTETVLLALPCGTRDRVYARLACNRIGTRAHWLLILYVRLECSINRYTQSLDRRAVLTSRIYH